MRLHGTVMPDQEQSAEHKLRDVYTVFAPNSFPMKINPIIRRNVFKINVNTETCIPNNFDNTRARPETLPATIFPGIMKK